MPILTQKALVLAKVETTAGTDAAPTNIANAVLVMEPNFTVESDEITRSFARSDFSQFTSVYGMRRGQMTFSVEVKGSGAAGTAPEWGVLLRGCGMNETISAGTSVAYAPMTDSLKTLTIWMYFDGVIHKMTGAMGTWSLSAEAGGIGKIDFTFTGNYSAPTQLALATGTFQSTTPPIVESAALAWNASASGLYAASWSIDMGNEVSLRKDVNSPQGLHSVYISGRTPTGGFTPEVSGALNDSFWADWAASTTRSFTAKIGATAGNITTFTAPAVQITSIGYADRDNIKTYDVGFGFRRSASTGNDELAVTLT